MKSLPKLAWYLGYAGLLPFFILTVAVLLRAPLPLLEGVRLDWWLVAYAAVVLSFLGAVHWGVVLGLSERLNEQESQWMLAYSIIPALLAWFAFLLPVNYALLIMGALMLLAYVVDSISLFPHLTTNYSQLRLQLTIAVSLLLFAAGLGVS